MNYKLGYLFILFTHYLAMSQMIADSMVFYVKGDLFINKNMICFNGANLVLDHANIDGTGFLYLKSSLNPAIVTDNSLINNLVISKNNKIDTSAFTQNNYFEVEAIKTNLNAPSYSSAYQLISANFDSNFEKETIKNHKKQFLKKNQLKKSNNVQIVFQYASDYQLCPLFSWHFDPFYIGDSQQKISFQRSTYLAINLKPLLNPPLV